MRSNRYFYQQSLEKFPDTSVKTGWRFPVCRAHYSMQSGAWGSKKISFIVMTNVSVS